MNISFKKIGLAYWLLAAAFIVSIFFKPYALSWLVKMLPILLMLVLVWRLGTQTVHRLFACGLLFSACGDFFLDYDREHWFIFGLGAFFVAHVFYITALKPFEKKAIGLIALYLVYGLGIFTLLAPNLGELFIPVTLYMLVLLLMGISTLTSTISNVYFKWGGCFFVLSDSLIGIDKFYQPIPNTHIAIMITYYLAQFFLVKGLWQYHHKQLLNQGKVTENN